MKIDKHVGIITGIHNYLFLGRKLCVYVSNYRFSLVRFVEVDGIWQDGGYPSWMSERVRQVCAKYLIPALFELQCQPKDPNIDGFIFDAHISHIHVYPILATFCANVFECDHVIHR